MDCNLSPTATGTQDVPGGDLCGPVTGADLNFGSVVRTRTVNPDVLHGWGIRPYDWVFDASIQQEIIPRLSVEFGYNRRTWGNFFVDDNRNLSPADYDVVTMTAPQNANLPDGGGYPMQFRVPRMSAATSNYYTFAGDFGDQTALYHSFQTQVRARTDLGPHAPGRHDHGPRCAQQLRDRSSAAGADIVANGRRPCASIPATSRRNG